MKHRDRHGLPQRFLNVEAFRGLDVFQVDSAAGGFQELAELDDIVGVLRAHFQIEDIDIGKALEEHGLAFHHRLGGVRANVAQAQHGRAVGDHRHQVAPRGVFKGQVVVLVNLLARLGHAGRIGQTQIPLRAARFGGRHFDLALAALPVIIQSVFAANFHRFVPSPSRCRVFFTPGMPAFPETSVELSVRKKKRGFLGASRHSKSNTTSSWRASVRLIHPFIGPSGHCRFAIVVSAYRVWANFEFPASRSRFPITSFSFRVFHHEWPGRVSRADIVTY